MVNALVDDCSGVENMQKAGHCIWLRHRQYMGRTHAARGTQRNKNLVNPGSSTSNIFLAMNKQIELAT